MALCGMFWNRLLRCPDSEGGRPPPLQHVSFLRAFLLSQSFTTPRRSWSNCHPETHFMVPGFHPTRIAIHQRPYSQWLHGLHVHPNCAM
jgi:hypothetical protein